MRIFGLLAAVNLPLTGVVTASAPYRAELILAPIFLQVPPCAVSYGSLGFFVFVSSSLQSVRSET